MKTGAKILSVILGILMIASGIYCLATPGLTFLAVGWKYGILDTFEELMRAKGWAERCFRRPSSWNPGKVPEPALSDLLGRMEAIDALVGAL